jgi:hypothetical protein
VGLYANGLAVAMLKNYSCSYFYVPRTCRNNRIQSNCTTA